MYGALSHFFSIARLMTHTSPGWGFQLIGALQKRFIEFVNHMALEPRCGALRPGAL